MKNAQLLMASPIDTSLLVLLAAGLAAAQTAGSAGGVGKGKARLGGLKSKMSRSEEISRKGGGGGLKSNICNGTHLMLVPCKVHLTSDL